MINLTGVIEITTTGYLPQFVLGDYKYDNADCIVTQARLKEIYIMKYDGKDYQNSVHPFKVEVINDKSNWR